jgi:hypothetical protein
MREKYTFNATWYFNESWWARRLHAKLHFCNTSGTRVSQFSCGTTATLHFQFLKTNFVTFSPQTIATERPPLVGEVSANFCGYVAWSAQRVPKADNLGFLDQPPVYHEIYLQRSCLTKTETGQSMGVCYNKKSTHKLTATSATLLTIRSIFNKAGPEIQNWLEMAPIIRACKHGY